VLVAAAPGPGCKDEGGGQNNNNQFPAVLGRSDALVACVISDACDVMPFGYASLCLSANWDQQNYTGTVPLWDVTYRCVLQAGGDCAAVTRCFALGQDPAPCTAVSDGWCDGSVRVYCDTFDQRLYRQDCSAADQTCVMSTVAAGVTAPACGLGTCTPATDVATCMDNLIATCDQGVWLQTDCASLGLICGDGRQGGKACVGAGTACNENTYQPSCQGNVLSTCVENHLATIDCAARPGVMTCDATADDCAIAGTECSAGEEACQGSLMYLCIDGFVISLDCADYGFSLCELRSGGAHCR
jgi:hypothetical protein